MNAELLHRAPAMLLAVLIAVLLAGCGPGTGGTGLPPASSADGGTAPTGGGTSGGDASSPPPAAAAPPAAVTSPAPTGAATVPARAPDLVGTVDAVDDTTLRIANLTVALALVDVVLSDGSPSSVAALRAGARVLAWVVGSRIVVQLRP